MKQDTIKHGTPCGGKSHLNNDIEGVNLVKHHTIPINTPEDYSGIPTQQDSIDEDESDKSCDDCNREPYVCLTCEHKDMFNRKLKYKGEDLMKDITYRATKPFCAESLLSEGPCKEEFDLFVKEFGFYTPLTGANIEYIVTERKVWFDWLLEHNFIESTEPRYTIRTLTPEEKEDHMVGNGEPSYVFVVWDNITDSIATGGFLFSVQLPTNGGDAIKFFRYTSANGHGLCKIESMNDTVAIDVVTE